MDQLSARDTFAKRLSELMKQEGTKQKELADLLNIKPQTVSQYTTGRTTPDYDSLCAIARHFGVTSDYLLGLSEFKTTAAEGTTAKDMGLSEDSVEILKLLKESQLNDISDGVNLILNGVGFFGACSKISDLYRRINSNVASLDSAALSALAEQDKSDDSVTLRGLSLYHHLLEKITHDLTSAVSSVTGLSELEDRTEEARDALFEKMREVCASKASTQEQKDKAVDRLNSLLPLLERYGADMIAPESEAPNAHHPD